MVNEVKDRQRLVSGTRRRRVIKMPLVLSTPIWKSCRYVAISNDHAKVRFLSFVTELTVLNQFFLVQKINIVRLD